MALTDLLTLSRPLVSLDLETTGTAKAVDRIVQIGLVKLYPDGRVTEWQSLVNPGMAIPREASAIHHIDDTSVIGAPAFAQLAPALLHGLTEVDFVGYNVGFDLSFLEAEFARVGMTFPDQYHKIDGAKIFFHYAPRTLTSALATYCGVALPDAHDALADAKAALQVVEAQLISHVDLPRQVSSLHARFFETIGDGRVDPDGRFMWRHGEAALAFGKHAGVAVRAVPRGYLQWMIDGEFQEPTKAICRQALRGVFPRKETE